MRSVHNDVGVVVRRALIIQTWGMDIIARKASRLLLFTSRVWKYDDFSTETADWELNG